MKKDRIDQIKAMARAPWAYASGDITEALMEMVSAIETRHDPAPSIFGEQRLAATLHDHLLQYRKDYGAAGAKEAVFTRYQAGQVIAADNPAVMRLLADAEAVGITTSSGFAAALDDVYRASGLIRLEL